MLLFLHVQANLSSRKPKRRTSPPPPVPRELNRLRSPTRPPARRNKPTASSQASRAGKFTLFPFHTMSLADLRYMPAALATVSAAAAQAQGAVNRAPGPAPTSAAAGFASGFAQATGARGFDVPSPSNSTREAGSRSRPTSLHLAQGHGHGQGHGGHGQGLGKSDSDDALSAGSGSGGSTVNLSGFAEIRREEAEGAIPAAPQGHARRTSGGWFWGKEKDKRE